MNKLIFLFSVVMLTGAYSMGHVQDEDTLSHMPFNSQVIITKPINFPPSESMRYFRDGIEGYPNLVSVNDVLNGGIANIYGHWSFCSFTLLQRPDGEKGQFQRDLIFNSSGSKILYVNQISKYSVNKNFNGEQEILMVLTETPLPDRLAVKDEQYALIICNSTNNSIKSASGAKELKIGDFKKIFKGYIEVRPNTIKYN